MTLISHKDTTISDLDRLLRAKPDARPGRVHAYHPVAFADIRDRVLHRADRAGLDLTEETFALNDKNTKVFGQFKFDGGDEGMGMVLGFRSCYDSRFATGFASGARVFVCDNGCFSGNVVETRRQTRFASDDISRILDRMVGDMPAAFETEKRRRDVLTARSVERDEGYAILGQLLGNDLITSRQASVAFGDWKKPRHAEFSERNGWGLYNAVTEGLKVGDPASTLDRNVACSRFIDDVLARPTRPQVAVV